MDCTCTNHFHPAECQLLVPSDRTLVSWLKRAPLAQTSSSSVAKPSSSKCNAPNMQEWNVGRWRSGINMFILLKYRSTRSFIRSLGGNAYFGKGTGSREGKIHYHIAPSQHTAKVTGVKIRTDWSLRYLLRLSDILSLSLNNDPPRGDSIPAYEFRMSNACLKNLSRLDLPRYLGNSLCTVNADILRLSSKSVCISSSLDS